MRIAIVLPVYWPAIGGCEIHTHELVTRLARRHEVVVITAISTDADKERGEWFMWAPLLAAPVRAEHYADGGARVTRVGMPALWRALLFLLLRIAGTGRLPAVLCRLAGNLFIAGYKRWLRKVLGKPDLIHGIHQDAPWFGYAAMQVADELGIPYAYTPVSHIYSADKAMAGAYTEQAPLSAADLPEAMQGRFGEMFLQCCRQADVVFTMTDAEKRFFEQSRINRHVLTIGVGPVLAATPAPNVRQAYGIPEDCPLILFLGRINQAKGVAFVLEAAPIVWGSVPNAHFLFVGPFERGSKALFDARPDRRIVAAGAVDLERKTGALQACDLLCLPSVNESLGGVYLEAWAFGKPVIGADIPPFCELTEGGQGGLAVAPSAAGVAQGILRLLQHPDQAAALGRWGRARVASRYNWDVIAAAVEAGYAGALASTMHPRR